MSKRYSQFCSSIHWLRVRPQVIQTHRSPSCVSNRCISSTRYVIRPRKVYRFLFSFSLGHRRLFRQAGAIFLQHDQPPSPRPRLFIADSRCSAPPQRNKRLKTRHAHGVCGATTGSPCSPDSDNSTTSTRRFSCRPFAVALSAMGRYSPYPVADNFSGRREWVSTR